MNDSPPAAAQRASSHAKAGLILATFMLFVSEHLVHYAMAVLALLGVMDAAREPGAVRDWHGRQLLLLFALLWLPMLLAAPGAVAPEHTWRTVLPYLHLLPAAWFVLRACADHDVRRLVTLGAALLIGFLLFDALVQLIWHRDLFGYPYDRNVLKGVFHPKQRLGLVLAVFAPLYLDAVLRGCRARPWLWLLLVPMVVIVLVSLKRSAWLMLAFGLALYAALLVRQRGLRWQGRRVAAWTLLLMMALGLATLDTSLRARFHETAGLFSGDAHSIDAASGWRLTLWRTGTRILADHWLTGVGPRGFRHVYSEYAAKDDFWIKRIGGGQTHPHQFMLEVAVETGVVGLVAFLAFYGRLLWLLTRATVTRTAPVWLLGAAVAWLPLNAHLAFYSAYWASLAWLLLAVGLAELRATGSEPV